MMNPLGLTSTPSSNQPANAKAGGLVGKRLNVKAAAVLLAVVVLLAVGVHFLHGYQVRSNAGILLAQADRAEADGKLQDVVNYLGRYVALVPTDTDARCKFAVLLANDKVAKTPKALLRAFFALSRAVQLEPERDDVRRRLVTVAMHPWLGRFTDAAAHLDKLPADGELLGLRARCLEESAKYPEAREHYENAIAAAPGELVNYVRLAHLLRTKSVEVRKDKDESLDALADAAIDAMVDANAKNYRAYLIRAAFRKQGPIAAADRELIERDVEAARKLAPEEIDVILAVAAVEREKRDPKATESARALLRAGIKQHPKEWRLVEALTRVETSAGQPEAALQCLRDGLKELPDHIDLLWNYAYLLIRQQDKDAESVIAKLATAGLPAAQLDYLKAGMLINDSEWLRAAHTLERVYPQFLRGYDERKNWFSFSLALECNLLLGTCYEQMGDPYRAAMAYDRVVVREPRSVAGRLGLARMKWALGQLDVAEKEYRQAVSQMNAPAQAWVELVQVLVARTRISARADWQAVLNVIDVAARQEAQRLTPAMLALLRAEVLAAKNDDQSYDAARRGLEGVNDAKGARPAEVWVGLAGLEMQRGNTAAALAILDAATKKLGDRAELRIARARLWARKGGAEAAKALAALSENGTRFDTAQRVRLYRAVAEAYSQLGEHKEATKLWRHIVALRDKNLSSRLALFDLSLLAGDVPAMDEQIAAIQKLEGAQEGSLWRYCRASQCIWQAQKGDKRGLAEAAELLRLVGERRPGWARVPLAQGHIDELRGRFDTAMANYERAVALGEQRPAVLQRLVRVLIEHGEVLAADKMIHKLRAQSPSLLNGLERPEAVALFYNGDKEQALKLARKAVPNDAKEYRDHIWLGQLYWAAGPENAKEAEESLRRAVALADQVPEAWLALVQHLVRVENKKEAEKVVSKAEATLPTGKGLLELAQCHEMIGNTDRAKKLYDAALAAAPEDPRVLYALAMYCVRSNKAEEAQSQLKRIVQLNNGPTSGVALARRLLALLIAAGGDLQKSQAALETLQAGTDETGTLTRADAAADQRARVVILANQQSGRKRREAIVILEGLRSKQSATLGDRYLLGRLYESVGEWKKARGQLAAVLTAVDEQVARTANERDKKSLQSVYAGYLAYYASELLRRGETAAAQPWQAKLERLEPDSWRSLEIKARLLGKEGHGADAVPFLRAVVQRDEKLLLPVAQVLEQIGQPTVAQAMFEKYAADTKEPQRVLELARFHARQDRPAQALDLCERAWTTCKPEEVAHASAAVIYLAKSGKLQCDRASRRIEQAIAAHPENTAMRVDLSALRRKDGRVDDAVKLLREVHARDKSNWVALNNVAWLLALQGRADDALAAIKEAIVLRGEHPYLLTTRAVANIAKGQHAAAVEDLQEAVAEAPTAERYFHLAQAQLGAGNRDSARVAIERAKNLGLTETSVDPLARAAYHHVLATIARR